MAATNAADRTRIAGHTDQGRSCRSPRTRYQPQCDADILPVGETNYFNSLLGQLVTNFASTNDWPDLLTAAYRDGPQGAGGYFSTAGRLSGGRSYRPNDAHAFVQTPMA